MIEKELFEIKDNKILTLKNKRRISKMEKGDIFEIKTDENDKRKYFKILKRTKNIGANIIVVLSVPIEKKYIK